jgi:hypothetical protein
MKWNNLLKKSIGWLLSIAIVLTLVTSAIANAPMPPSQYWIKFDSPAKLHSVQIAQCQNKQCQQSRLIRQYGTCTQSGCLTGASKLIQSKSLQLDCADNLCLAALSPFYDIKELDPDRLYFIAQLDDRVVKSKIFPLTLSKESYNTFTATVIAERLEIARNPTENNVNSPLFQNIFFGSLFLTLGIESLVWGGYLRRKQAVFDEISATILSVFIVHAFSFGIVWLSFVGLRNFAPDAIRFSGLGWLIFAIIYGCILSLHARRVKNPLSTTTIVGSIAYWIGAVFASLIVAFLFGYGSPLPSSFGVSEPIAILLSEIFVIGYEAWIIQTLRRDTLDFKISLLLSLVANTLSCAIGLVIAFLLPK